MEKNTSEMASLSLSATTPHNLILGFSPRTLIPTLNAVKLRTFASPASSSLRVLERVKKNKSPALFWKSRTFSDYGVVGTSYKRGLFTLQFYKKLSLKVTTRLQINQRQLTVFATNSNSASTQKPPNEEGVVNETSKASEGPPLLTILAGAFVFFIICWLIGSVVMWLISLIVNVPPPK